MNAEVYPELQFPTSEVNKTLAFFLFSQSSFIFTVKALSTHACCVMSSHHIHSLESANLLF